ncbi:MAG: NapC/NirT family cytochrome c [Phycisphaeraceae bacterium]|nr:MAG: NapC/NirT family cytochrome c [Phycisphaeraceae bacterium]
MKRIWGWLWAKKRKWRGLALVAFVVFVVGSLVSVEITSQPPFCGTCHIMKPYYASWKDSAHADVSCVKCHIPPGANSYARAKLNGLGQVVDDVLHRTSFKPSASVTALSCTRSGCHSIETLEGMKIDNGVFKFRHDKHIGRVHLGVEIQCGTCHSHVMGDKHFEVNTSVCINCHLLEDDPANTRRTVSSQMELRLAIRTGYEPTPEPGSDVEARPPSTCITCHDAPEEVFEYQGLKVDHKAFLEYGASCESCHRSATAQPPPIEDGRCVECHTFGVERALPPREMHQAHLNGEHKIECFNCHGMVQHGLTAQAMSLEQFDCQRCHINQHSAQRDAYLLAAIPPAEAAHGIPQPGGQAINPMFLAHVDCTGCHVDPKAATDNPMNPAQIRTASAASCDRCHKPGMGEKMIPLWQDATHKLFDEATRRMEQLASDGANTDQAAGIADARALLELVRLDGSWGVHNPGYTQELLKKALAALPAASDEPSTDTSSTPPPASKGAPD